MFIGRRPDGSIYGTWTVRQAGDVDHPGLEEVADNHPDLVAFQVAQAAQRQSVTLSNGNLAAMLVKKGLISQADVDAAVAALVK